MTKEEVLKQCTVEGNVVKLPDIQLDRKLYMDVAKALQLIGGKWKGGKTFGFVFDENPTEYLEQIAGGEKRNLKKEFQFFATPDSLADRLIELADIMPVNRVLEPSAGQGAIIKAIHRKQPKVIVDYCELMPLNKTYLEKLSNVNWIGDDFLLLSDVLKYDRIIANPPFAKNQDIDHTLKMYNHLNSGGRMVVIVSKHWQSSSNSKGTQFRKWLNDVNAKTEEISEKTFKESGTTIATVILTIDKKNDSVKEPKNITKEKVVISKAETSPVSLDEIENDIKNAIKDLKIINELNEMNLDPKSYKNQYELNKAIEALLDEKHGIAGTYTDDEKLFLTNYAGYGGLDKFAPEDEINKGWLNEFYTPDKIVDMMWALALKYGYKEGQPMLEPATGIGKFFKYAKSCQYGDAIGYEINKYSALITMILYPNVVVNIKSFETLFIKDNNSIKGKVKDLRKFNLVITNPPYGDYSGFYAGMGEDKYTRAGNWIEYFITRGLDLLVSGGLLIMIVGAEKRNGGRLFLEGSPNACKEMIAAKADLIDAYRLPRKLFSNTQVETEIIVLRKH